MSFITSWCHISFIPKAVFTPDDETLHSSAHKYSFKSFGNPYAITYIKCFAYLKTSLLFAESGRIVGTSGGSLRGPPSFPAITMLAPTSDSTKNECQWVYRSSRGAIANIKERKKHIVRSAKYEARICMCCALNVFINCWLRKKKHNGNTIASCRTIVWRVSVSSILRAICVDGAIAAKAHIRLVPIS